jgi:hypothetical protein|tara:strand:+ start:4177 stop:4452 length:276 start_codon:yes stop_codon:yes gene_type:complete
MSDFVKPVAAEIAAPTTSGAASTVSDAKVVRVVNTTSGASHLVSIIDTNDAAVGSMTIPGHGVAYIPKASTDKVWAANASIKLASVTWPRG